MNDDATLRALLFMAWLAFWRVIVPSGMALAVVMLGVWELFHV